MTPFLSSLLETQGIRSAVVEKNLHSVFVAILNLVSVHRRQEGMTYHLYDDSRSLGMGGQGPLDPICSLDPGLGPTQAPVQI